MTINKALTRGGVLGGHIPGRRKAEHVGPDPRSTPHSGLWQLSGSHREEGWWPGEHLQAEAIPRGQTRVSQLQSGLQAWALDPKGT